MRSASISVTLVTKWPFDFELISTPPGSTLSGICWQVVIESAPSWSQKIVREEQRYLEITGGAALRVADPVIAHIGIFSYPMWTTKPSFKNVQQWYICENLWPSTSQAHYFPFTLPDCCRRPIPVRDANCYHDPVDGVGEVMYPLTTIYSGPGGLGMLIRFCRINIPNTP